MESVEEVDEEGLLLRGQAQVWQLMFGFADSMALKAAVELRLADIIHSYAGPLTLSQIASDGGAGDHQTVYGSTHISKWLLHDSDPSLAPMVLQNTDIWQLAPWQYISHSIKQGGTPFKKAYACDMWEFTSHNPTIDKLFNDAMGCTNKIVVTAFLSQCKDGGFFHNIRSLVDVGGGNGGAVAEIVKTYPHIKGINFDLPHVVATAPVYDGVSHVGGNMFETIPNSDAVFMKWVLHDWGDEDCVKILKNCRKAIPGKDGKLVLVEIVVEEDGNKTFGDMDLVYDLLMFVLLNGKERTEQEWKKLLEEGGFPRYNIINIPAFPSIIEAYPF
ncbi:hypothetical protein Q3G72_020408 [Acer saccharum]|nr:hypothetical protein Q3G72_020408 [Acer saccharum]